MDKIEKELARLRAAQADAVMPLIGGLLDAWEFLSHDVREMIVEDQPVLAEYLGRINEAMETAGDV